MTEDFTCCYGGSPSDACEACRNRPDVAGLPWTWSRPYGNANGIRIEDAFGRTILTGYCRSDEDAERIVQAVNATIERTEE